MYIRNNDLLLYLSCRSVKAHLEPNPGDYMINKTNLHEAFKTALPVVLFVDAIFFFNFISRMILASLMPVIELDLGFSHAGAGQLFLTLAFGTGAGLLLNCFISRTVNHRKTVGNIRNPGGSHCPGNTPGRELRHAY